jgi:AcrR family transcriptional regulator
MLEEAASELFLEQGYAKTTIEQITQRAGVSRNTFFNYFAAKSDLLWVELDTGLGVLDAQLTERQTMDDPLAAVREALAATARTFTPDRAPLVLTQHDVMGIDAELRATGLARALAHADLIERFLASRLPALKARAVALAVVGAAAAAVGAWAGAGPVRAPLETYLLRVIRPVLAGFAG